MLAIYLHRHRMAEQGTQRSMAANPGGVGAAQEVKMEPVVTQQPMPMNPTYQQQPMPMNPTYQQPVDPRYQQATMA